MDNKWFKIIEKLKNYLDESKDYKFENAKNLIKKINSIICKNMSLDIMKYFQNGQRAQSFMNYYIKLKETYKV
jgi:hypothetical protein